MEAINTQYLSELICFEQATGLLLSYVSRRAILTDVGGIGIQEAKAGQPVQGQLELYSKFRFSMSYNIVRPSLKANKPKDHLLAGIER